MWKRQSQVGQAGSLRSIVNRPLAAFASSQGGRLTIGRRLPACPTKPLLSLRAPTFFLFGLQLIEQGVEALETALPKPPVPLQPSAHFRKRLRLEPAGPALRV